jgi:hypothetical protein
MRLSLNSIESLLEQASKKVVLSADRGDYQHVMRGDPFDYEFDSEKDIFTVTGVNSKRNSLSDKKIDQLEKGVGSKFDSGTSPYKVLKKRMADANLAPEEAGKKPRIPKKLDKGTKLSLDYLSTSSVNGKKINGPMVALALSSLTESDLEKLVGAAEDVNKYAGVVIKIVNDKYMWHNETINKMDLYWASAETLATGAAFAGAPDALALLAFSGVGGAAVGKTAMAGAAIIETLASLPVAVAVGLPLTALSLYAEGALEDIEESQMEVVLMDIRPMLASVKPMNLTGFASALKTLTDADPEFMEVLPYHALYKALLPDMWYGLGWAGVQWDDFEDEARARTIIEKALKDGKMQQLYDGFMKEMRAKSDKPKDLVDILATKGGGLEDLSKKVADAIKKKKKAGDSDLLTPKEVEALLAIVPLSKK